MTEVDTTRALFRFSLTLGLAILALAAVGMLQVRGFPEAPAAAHVPGDSRDAAVSVATSFTVHVPSPEGTGLPTGTLAVRVFGPPAGQARYPHGAPVVVWVPGAEGAGSLSEPLPLATDTVRITFLFPGGCAGPICSDGAYDYRGARCIAALRDVTLYAGGALTDVTGHAIDDVVVVPVLHDNVGLFGASNGGNIVAAVAAFYGDALTAHLRYLVQWESPVSSQMATGELGPPRQDCPTGTAEVMSANPRYQAYGPLTATVDYTQLAFTTTNPAHTVFWDGDGDGRYTTVTDTHTGCQTPDLDLDGVMSTTEDFPLGGYDDGTKQVYSRPATHAMAEQSIFSPSPWPSDIANPAQADVFWDLREAVRLYLTATLEIPDLEGMILASTMDHVQIAPDRPHIRQAFEGWMEAGAWAKINPAPHYAVEIDPALAARTDLPDNAANTLPDDWSAGDYAYPDDLDRVYQAAAVHEMADRVPVYVDLPSGSTGSPSGTLAVRIDAPSPGRARYPDGAPVLIWVHGGYTPGKLCNDLPDAAADLIVVNFLFPGGSAPVGGCQSDGTFDERGVTSTLALRDVILYAAGVLTDSLGRTIDEVVPVDVLHDNVGLLGASNGGNIIVAVAALHGDDLAGHLRYVVQWETPVSSQIANRDLGRVVLEWESGRQGDFVNPRYTAYGPLTLTVDYSDLAYDPSGPIYKIFHDGNGDGHYTTITDVFGYQTPDLDGDGVLTTTEDFPLGNYPGGTKEVYSRPATHAFQDYDVLSGTWPITIATPVEADAYWDVREAVRLYVTATTAITDLQGMVLASVRDHVQSAPDKPHIRQAFEGWHDNGAWVQINPSPAYLIEADPSLAGRTDLPNRVPNTPPADWEYVESYCVPEDISDGIYQLAAVWQMADRAQGVFTPTPAGAELITYVDAPPSSPPKLGGREGGRIAVRIEVPLQPRYPEGAPVVVEVSTWFVPGQGFHRVNETTQIGAITVSYLWPERTDPDSGAQSEGVYDYGGPDSLEVLRDVIRFASGLIPNVDGYYINELVAITPLTDNVGLFASSHAGVVATNVLAHHGAELPTVKYLIGRENPTRDEMYPLELGHFDEHGSPVYNPFYDEGNYSPITVTVVYSTVGWYQENEDDPGRPYFAAYDGFPEHILYEEIGPRLWDDKRYYSRALTQALYDNDAFGEEPWPDDLATITETLAAWPYRITVHNYPTLTTSAPHLRVMLVFADRDHVQAASSKPHIHQAWDGFRGAGLWVRMNPDRAYVEQVQAEGPFGDYPDNDANAEPGDWSDARPLGFPHLQWSRQVVWLASVAEMADRVRADNWDDNLDEALYPPSQPAIYLPLMLKQY